MYRDHGRCKYAYVTVGYGIVGCASTWARFHEVVMWAPPPPQEQALPVLVAGIHQRGRVVTITRNSSRAGRASAVRRVPGGPGQRGAEGAGRAGPARCGQVLPGRPPVVGRVFGQFTIPGRLIGRTRAFGALNRGSNPRPGAAATGPVITGWPLGLLAAGDARQPGAWLGEVSRQIRLASLPAAT